ncbi:hypothetical protein GCM10009733_059120 [Nonomuraea maheshkhaliensis]|uniref:DUF4190 domain-containing protein n=2 Tax=Nonomuraea maheshkhaliensis TaxID=419590 RepID=A0ABP4RLV8_9ACTN
MAAIALLLGLETMSWVAAGIAVILGIVPLLRTLPPMARVGGGNAVRRTPNWAQLATLAAAVVIIGAAVGIKGVIGQNSAEGAACARPRDPITEAKVTSAGSNAFPDLRMKSMAYSLSYNGTEFMYLEVTGQIVGEVPDDQLLYPFGTADPKSRDMYNNPGSGRFFWGKDELIVPDRNGCWSKPQREFGGYAGARGLTFYYHLGLVPRGQLSCLQALVSTKAGREHGQNTAELARCGVTLLGYAHIPTDRP